MTSSKQSLRDIAKELDISPAYLSYMVNGKRPWRKDLYQRYMGVVNTFVNSEGPAGAGFTPELGSTDWARSAQHLHGVQGAPGSNPGAPTKTLCGSDRRFILSAVFLFGSFPFGSI